MKYIGLLVQGWPKIYKKRNLYFVFCFCFFWIFDFSFSSFAFYFCVGVVQNKSLIPVVFFFFRILRPIEWNFYSGSDRNVSKSGQVPGFFCVCVLLLLFVEDRGLLLCFSGLRSCTLFLERPLLFSFKGRRGERGCCKKKPLGLKIKIKKKTVASLSLSLSLSLSHSCSREAKKQFLNIKKIK